MSDDRERNIALGQLVTLKNRLKKIHYKAGYLLGDTRQEIDDVIGKDFMDMNLKNVAANIDELHKLQSEAKILNNKIDAIQARYNFEDLDLE